MLELATFIMNLAGTIGSGFHNLGLIRTDQRERQSHYLDCISETLASAGMAIGDDEDITKQLAELRYHLSEIGSVLRLGDPEYLMTMNDNTVARLRAELDDAIGKTGSLWRASRNTNTPCSEADFQNQSQAISQRSELRSAFLHASGVFRGASVALRGRL